MNALCRPMLTDVGAWVIGCPTIENGGQSMSLGTTGRQVPSEDAHQHQVRLSGEVGDVLCDHHPFLGSCGNADFGISHAREPDLAYVHCVMVEFVPQLLGRFGWEHLVEEESHPRSERRRSVASRPAAIASSLRAMKVSTSSECAAANSSAVRICRGWSSVSAARTSIRSSSLPSSSRSLATISHTSGPPARAALRAWSGPR